MRIIQGKYHAMLCFVCLLLLALLLWLSRENSGANHLFHVLGCKMLNSTTTKDLLDPTSKPRAQRSYTENDNTATIKKTSRSENSMTNWVSKSDKPVIEESLNLTELQKKVYDNLHRLNQKLSNVTMSTAVQFYNLSRRSKTNHCDFDFLVNGSNICSDNEPFLIVIVPSAPRNVEQRMVIRETWGKYAKDMQMPPPHNAKKVVLGFLMGRDGNPIVDDNVQKLESEKYRDVIIGNFHDMTSCGKKL